MTRRFMTLEEIESRADSGARVTARWADNREPATRRFLPLGDGTCWCGDRYGHDWEGKAARRAAPPPGEDGRSMNRPTWPVTAPDANGDVLPRGVVPPGRYAQGGRSPVVYVYLCPACGGYAPITDPEDHDGFLSGECLGCGAYTRELHRFTAVIYSAEGCSCHGSHPRVTGDLPESAGRYAWSLIPPPDYVTGGPR